MFDPFFMNGSLLIFLQIELFLVMCSHTALFGKTLF